VTKRVKEEAGNKEIIKKQGKGIMKRCFFFNVWRWSEQNKEVYILDKE